MHYSFVLVYSFLAGAIAAPAANSKRHVVHERREHSPVNWNKNAKLHGDSFLPLRIALTQSNLDRAEEFMMDVSHPESPNFGKHWTAKQVAEAFAPSHDTVAAVLDWLTEHGITGKQSQGLNWIEADITVAEAENLMNTKYYEWKHAVTDQTHVACDEYSIPEHIQGHIDFIVPSIHFDAKVESPKKRRNINAPRGIHDVVPGVGNSIGSPNGGSLPKVGSTVPLGTILNQLEHCNQAIVPNCLRALYGFPADFPANSKNSFGIVEYTPQAYVASDLDLFFKNFSSSQVGARPTLDSIDGGFIQTKEQSFGYNGESNLDLEYGMALVYPQKVTLYQVGDYVEGASFNNFLDAIDGSYCTYEGGDDPTQDGIYPDPIAPAGTFGVYKGPKNCGGFAATKVISTSYGYNEADLSVFYENRQCNEYMKLGLQGVTVVYSSGDSGVAGNGGHCIDPATGQYNDGKSGMFNPSFPSTCPYVTSVGATQIAPGAGILSPEEAAETVIYSGGGFSNVFAKPDYQTSALSTYFKQHKPAYGSDRYNTSQNSRGFPDVSANGVNYVVAIDGNFSYVYGTSASAPTFASILTLINAARLDVGKSTVGFINPVIYKHPEMFNDITSGGNQGCGTTGFQAVSGWDPVTGLGTPNFPKMLATWLLLP